MARSGHDFTTPIKLATLFFIGSSETTEPGENCMCSLLPGVGKIIWHEQARVKYVYSPRWHWLAIHILRRDLAAQIAQVKGDSGSITVIPSSKFIVHDGPHPGDYSTWLMFDAKRRDPKRTEWPMSDFRIYEGLIND